jgi:hypothetical protein
VVSAIPFLLALYFQLGFGWTAARSGLVVVALLFGNVAIKPATTPLMRRFGIRSVMLGAGLGVAIGALFVSLGGRLAGTLGLGSGADEPFRVVRHARRHPCPAGSGSTDAPANGRKHSHEPGMTHMPPRVLDVA